MSFDIYGNHLRRRHCEVHPEVPEEYPCFVCRYKDKLKTYSESQPPEPTSEDYLVADAIAARDKWWVKWFDDLIMGCDGGYGPECKDKPIILDISINQWQSLKQSLEVKE